MNRTFVTLSFLAAYISVWKHSSATASRNPACSLVPDVENCTIVLLRWSFSSELNECKRNYVCRENQNNFVTKDLCEASCPPVPGVKPVPKPKDCHYWLANGHACYTYWFTSLRDYWGRQHPVMVYTGCGQWRRKIYVYYMETGKCTEIKQEVMAHESK
uniref:Putative bovine pancreatic trypsin inhibitor n=1 Tax=Rhipicephalus microplus TaxID=6941 RepID=A0A6G5A7H0_RHIMP